MVINGPVIFFMGKFFFFKLKIIIQAFQNKIGTFRVDNLLVPARDGETAWYDWLGVGGRNFPILLSLRDLNGDL